jgi:branched-chain amino acid transport system permease protein
MTTLFDVKKNPRKAYTSFIVMGLILVMFPFIATHFGNSWVRIVDLALLYIMLALGLNIVVGFAGLLDLGYIAFYAVGAYLAALFASPQFSLVLSSLVESYPETGNFLVTMVGADITANGIHLPVWIIVPMAAIVAGVFGALGRANAEVTGRLSGGGDTRIW